MNLPQPCDPSRLGSAIHDKHVRTPPTGNRGQTMFVSSPSFLSGHDNHVLQNRGHFTYSPRFCIDEVEGYEEGHRVASRTLFVGAARRRELSSPLQRRDRTRLEPIKIIFCPKLCLRDNSDPRDGVGRPHNRPSRSLKGRQARAG